MSRQKTLDGEISDETAKVRCEYWEEFFTVSLNYLTNGECFIQKEVNKN